MASQSLANKRVVVTQQGWGGANFCGYAETAQNGVIKVLQRPKA